MGIIKIVSVGKLKEVNKGYLDDVNAVNTVDVKEPKSAVISTRLILTIALTFLFGTCVCFAVFVLTMRPEPEHVCEGDSGLRLNGARYSCEVLLNEALSNENVPGLYYRRHMICTDKQNGCCQTCQDVLKEKCDDSGLQIADGSYDCKALINKTFSDSKALGVHERRVTLCSQMNFHGCCKTCQTVLEEASQCRDTGLQIGDGSYECRALVDKSYSDKKELGAFENNFSLCSKEEYRLGCCKTCEIVLKSKAVCRDSGLDIADGSYDCSALIDKVYSDKKNLGAYEKNVTLCRMEEYRRGCCKTCETVLTHESSRNSDKHKTHLEENSNDDTKQTTEDDIIETEYSEKVMNKQ